MPSEKNLKKLTSVILVTTFVASTALPVSTAQAHDRHNASKHYGHSVALNKRSHRQFHKTYGRGKHGQANYRQQQAQIHAHNAHRSNKRRKNRELIAAGIIGLAVGAIIASEASKNRNPQPTYQYSDPYNGSHSHNGHYTPLREYNETYPPTNGYDNGPNVITYNDDYSLEPWTPGWQAWCTDRYRSFNARTGTYRGYDGLDHFCVPK